jgi:hypothetical protein
VHREVRHRRVGCVGRRDRGELVLAEQRQPADRPIGVRRRLAQHGIEPRHQRGRGRLGVELGVVVQRERCAVAVVGRVQQQVVLDRADGERHGRQREPTELDGRAGQAECERRCDAGRQPRHLLQHEHALEHRRPARIAVRARRLDDGRERDPRVGQRAQAGRVDARHELAPRRVAR